MQSLMQYRRYWTLLGKDKMRTSQNVGEFPGKGVNKKPKGSGGFMMYN